MKIQAALLQPRTALHSHQDSGEFSIKQSHKNSNQTQVLERSDTGREQSNRSGVSVLPFLYSNLA